MREQLSSANLPFEFVDAIDGRKGLPERFLGMIDRDRTFATLGREMSDAEYACALSHMSVMQKVLQKGLDGAVVLEDDAELQPGFCEFLERKIFLAANLVQLDYMAALVWKFGSKHYTDLTLHKLVHKAPLGTGYTISRYGCEYITKNGLPIHATSDWPVEVSKIGAMVTRPKLVISADRDFRDSSLHQERTKREQRSATNRGGFTRTLRRVRSFCAEFIATRLP